MQLASMVMPSDMLTSMRRHLSDEGTMLQVSNVVLSDVSGSSLTGSMTHDHAGSEVYQPPDWFTIGTVGTPVFTVNSGPCTISNDGRCVGRPDGYGINEFCEITVAGGSGTIARCPVYDLQDSDRVIVNGVDEYHPRNDGPQQSNDRIYCPAGVRIILGDQVSWTSSGSDQGNYGPGHGGFQENGCTAAGTCGLPHSDFGLGGGWQICLGD